MDFFHRAKAVRLKSQHNKYLVAHEDEEGVKQDRHGSSKSARWVVEMIEGKPNKIRLKSSQSWKYLATSDHRHLLGATGKKVIQASPRLRLDSSVEWEPIKEGPYVKLRTSKGDFLRANGAPWYNSVTHDVPSQQATQGWILWIVDVLDVDYQASPAVTEEEVKRVSVSSTAESNNVVNDIEEDQASSMMSRTSSYSSSVSKTEDYTHYHEVESSPVRSDQRPSPAASKTSANSQQADSAKKPTGVSPHIEHIRNESKHSNSFNKLKSMLDGLQDLLDGEEEKVVKENYDYASHPHQFEVNMAKQILKDMKNENLSDILVSGRDKKLEKAVEILVSDAKASSQGQTLKDLENVLEKLNYMKNDHESASQDLIDCTSFSTKRLEVKAGLKKDAAKAHELETLEVGFTNILVTARAKREELLKQLAELENSIRVTEKAQADNAVDIEELISSIGNKSESLRDMERNEKSWQSKKLEAERTLESVEEEWERMKRLLQDI